MKKLLFLLISLVLSTHAMAGISGEQNTIHSVILAGGSGKRMKSDLPKVLHKLNGVPLVEHVIKLAKDINSDSICIVTSPSLKDRLSYSGINVAIQDKPLGTGHAVLSAEPCLKDKSGDLFILYGDTPNIKPDTLSKMKKVKNSKNAQIAVLGMRPEDTKRYGRIFVSENGYVDRIVEHRDASDEERKNNLCNSGVFLVDLKYLLPLLKEIKNKNAVGEYYLTDIVQIAQNKGLKTVVIEAHEHELLGVNTQEELKAVSQLEIDN